MPMFAQNLNQTLTADAVIPTLFAGASVAVLAWWFWRTMQSGDLEQGKEWRYDVSRINELRQQDAVYRIFQPVIQPLARFNSGIFGKSLSQIEREIQAAGMTRYWLPEEYLGKLQLIGILLIPIFMAGLCYRFGIIGFPLSISLGLLSIIFLRRQLTYRANYRIRAIKRRMPYLLDLMTLLMEAGTTFMRALEQAVNEFRGHPLSDEFRRVLTDINLGKTRQQAFEGMQKRLSDDEITSIIGSMVQAEILGTPLAAVFRAQSDLLRLKRSQDAETVAAEAGVKILLPSILVMAATVIIIIGPFILNFLIFGLNF